MIIFFLKKQDFKPVHSVLLLFRLPCRVMLTLLMTLQEVIAVLM